METQESNVYRANTEAFQGPLDLLLSLVESRKLFINDISLALIADEYFLHVNKKIDEFKIKKEKDYEFIENITSYIVVLATLILIKTRSLLPNTKLTTEESSEIKNLEQRMELYKYFKIVSRDFGKLFGNNEMLLPKKQPKILNKNKLSGKVFNPGDTDLKTLSMLIKKIVETLPKKEVLPNISISKMISLRDRIDEIMSYFQNENNTDFSNIMKNHKFTETKEKNIFQIVSFLAILEIARNGIVDLNQENLFGNIKIIKQ